MPNAGKLVFIEESRRCPVERVPTHQKQDFQLRVLQVRKWKARGVHMHERRRGRQCVVANSLPRTGEQRQQELSTGLQGKTRPGIDAKLSTVVT